MKLKAREFPGRNTDLQCTCGNPLQEILHVYEDQSSPPYHRKKRIRKKWRKRWEEERGVRHLLGAMIGLLRRPTYRCIVCGRHDSFYSAIGRNLVVVEPLPNANTNRTVVFKVEG